MNNTAQFADFLVDTVVNYLTNNNVVKICLAPSCYIYLGSHPERRGRNPENGEEIIRKAGNDLRWFIPEYDDQFTEEQFLESLKRNNIQLVTKEFPTIQDLLDEARKLYGDYVPITTSDGKTLVELYFDNNQFWWMDEQMQYLLKKFPTPLLAYDKNHGLKVKRLYN